MGSFLSAIVSPLSVLIQGASDIIGKFVASPEDKLKAQETLVQLQADFQKALVAADQSFAEMQAKVITAEASGESWLQRNWRPLLMLTFTVIIANNYIFAPYFSVGRMLTIPDQMWELLKLGITGYIVGRSAEKTVPDIVAALKK